MNPAYINEDVDVDVDEVDPVDLAPLVSGNAPIVTAPAQEVGDVAEDTVEDKDMDEDTDVLVRTMQEVMDRLAKLNHVRVGKLLHRLQERVDQHTWKRDDKYMMDGLANIVVLPFRLDKLTERATKGPKL